METSRLLATGFFGLHRVYARVMIISVMKMFDSLQGRKPCLIGYDQLKKYAVGIPLLMRENRWNILFEVRAKSLRRQPGEICFPGGRVEDGESFETAAVREICEELKLNSSDVRVVAPMDVNLSPAGQLVVPFLMELKQYDNTWNEDEVDTVFCVPMEYFLEHTPSCYKNKIYTEAAEDLPLDKIPGGRNYPWHTGYSDVYFYDVPNDACMCLSKVPKTGVKSGAAACDGSRNRVIWGLTARIMQSAAEIIRGGIGNERKESER